MIGSGPPQKPALPIGLGLQAIKRDSDDDGGFMAGGGLGSKAARARAKEKGKAPATAADIAEILYEDAKVCVCAVGMGGVML